MLIVLSVSTEPGAVQSGCPASRGQPRDDMLRVPEATPADLGKDLVAPLLRRLRVTWGPLFTSSADEEVLRVIVDAHGPRPSLAGLLLQPDFCDQLSCSFTAWRR